MKILIINGPNLNLLGKRNPDIYGHRSLNELNTFVKDYFKKVKLEFYQSNHEGDIIDRIHQAMTQFDGIVINPGALTHYSYALRDAIEACTIPVVEVHLSNVAARESFRNISVISEVCQGTISGFGAYGYVIGVQALAHRIKRLNND